MAAADFKSGASGVSPWRIPARSPLAVGFFNAASRFGTHWRAALDCGAAGAPERTVALRLLSPAACAALEERFRTGEAPLPEAPDGVTVSAFGTTTDAYQLTATVRPADADVEVA